MLLKYKQAVLYGEREASGSAIVRACAREGTRVFLMVR